MIKVRKGQAPSTLSRADFGERFRGAYLDPVFRAEAGIETDLLDLSLIIGIEGVHRAPSDWLDWMGLIDAGAKARLDRFIGHYEPYATSHDALDQDQAAQDEVRNVAQSLVEAVGESRAGRLSARGAELAVPRPK